MSLTLPLRLLTAVAISLGLALVLLVLLYATDLAFAVWARLRATPLWFIVLYLGLVASLAGAGGYLVWRALVPRRSPQPAPAQITPPSETEVQQRLVQAAEIGVEVGPVTRELAELAARREAGEIHVALLGQVSTGKSSLIRALLPGAEPEVGPVGGTTRVVTRYQWQSPAGDRLVLTDLPGLAEADGRLDALSREEAQRAHVVVYLVDGDLTRDQYQALQAVLALDKPVVLALNKSDLLSAADLGQVGARLRERVAAAERVEVVAVSAGAERELVRVHPDGREEVVTRRLPARMDGLAAALQRRIDADREALDGLRDAAVFVLARAKLDEALAAHRRERAEAIVAGYTKKAVLAALAAVSPGTDLLIQGYLGVQLVRELGTLYEAPIGQVEIERLLRTASRRFGRTLPLLLAVAGNGLKAFPGLGTLAGGVVHAVAYGLLFDSLGKAVADTLASRGVLAEQVALQSFEERLRVDVETRARALARIALGEGRGTDAGG
jgi:hypothetical protein